MKEIKAARSFKKDSNVVKLIRLGSHSELFG